MATILHQLTLKEVLGTKIPAVPQSAPIAKYTGAEINTLLAGTSPVPEGVRFHFEKAAGNFTVGLIAVSLGVRPIDNPAGGTEIHNFEITSATKNYLRRDNTGAGTDLTATQYRDQFPTQGVKASSRDGITNACVFFSRTDLREVLTQEGVTGIALFLSSIERTFTTSVVETYDTLVVAGLNSTGAIQGSVIIRSESPCPPHCGDDYP